MHANRDRETEEKQREKDTFMAGHLLQRMVDVGKIRGFVWCRKCAGWASSTELVKRLQDPGERRDPNAISKGPLVFLGDVLVTKNSTNACARFVKKRLLWHSAVMAPHGT